MTGPEDWRAVDHKNVLLIGRYTDEEAEQIKPYLERHQVMVKMNHGLWEVRGRGLIDE